MRKQAPCGLWEKPSSSPTLAWQIHQNSLLPWKNKSVAACSPTTPHLHSPKEVALVGAFCTPSALNLGDPASFSRNASHVDRVGQRRPFRHMLAEQQGSVFPSAPPSPNSARCHAGKFRLVISCPQVDKNTSTVLSCTKSRLIPRGLSSPGAITHFCAQAGTIKLPFNHPQLTELP